MISFLRARRVLRTTAALAILSAVGCGTRLAVPPAGEAQAIRSVWESTSVALCAGDPESYRRLWADRPDVELLRPDGPQRIVGSGAILDSYDELFASGQRCSHSTTRFDVHVSPSGEIAWASAEGEAVFPAPRPTQQRAWYTLIFKKSEGSWRLLHAHASAIKDLGDSLAVVQSTDRAGGEPISMDTTPAYPQADSAAIRAVYTQWFSALEQRDMGRALNALAPDAELITPTGELLVGHTAIGNALEPFLADHQEEIDWDLQIVSLTSDRAMVRIREVTKVWPCAGGDGFELRGWHTGTLNKIDSRWLIVQDAGTLDGPPRPITESPQKRC